MRASLYKISVEWSAEDHLYLARVREFPSLTAAGPSTLKARLEMLSLLRAVLVDLKKNGETIPQPISGDE